MQANVIIECDGCGKHIGIVHINTADVPDVLQYRINKPILAHRQQCPAYKEQ